MGLGGSLVGGGGNFEVIIQEANHKGMGTFLCGGGGLIPRDFNLAIREGLGWVKWFKKWRQGKVLYFMQLFLHYIVLGENFIGEFNELQYL